MSQHRLSSADLVLVVVYFLAMGVLASRLEGKKTDTRSYLLGEKDIPWWAVTLSILGSEISALTFVGVPARAYTDNWSYLQVTIAALTSRWIVARSFVDAFYRYEVTSIYEFLEIRFGPRTRLTAAVTFLVTRVLMSGVRLYAGALLAESALGISAEAAVTLLALLGLAYTIKGGIKAVIWIEVIQVTVMFGGALLSLYLLGLPIGLPPEKLKVLSFSLDPAEEFTLWSALIGTTLANVAIFGTDYDMVQRMLTAQDSRRSRLAVLASGFANFPVTLLFLAVGSSLFLHYQTHPDPSLPVEAKKIFPHFILTAMPVGAAGLVVAAVLSVVLSSFQSALNSLAGSFVVDLYRPRLAPGRSEQHYLRVTRMAMLGFTVGLIAVGLFAQGAREILTLGLEIGTYSYGAMLAVFATGLFTRRGNDFWCPLSVPLSIAAVVAAKLLTPLSFPWFVMIGCLTGTAICLLGGSSPPAQQPDAG